MRYKYSEEGFPLRAHNLRPIEYHGILHLAYTSVLETDALKDTINVNMNSSCAVVEHIMLSGDHVVSDPYNGHRLLSSLGTYTLRRYMMTDLYSGARRRSRPRSYP